MRVLRHHRHLRAQAPDQAARAGRPGDRHPASPGRRVIFLVDDNFIGNKKAAKEILRAIIVWQHEHGYPVTFFTEASLDLAEDDELMRLMTEAGLVAVFIGIESPDEEALRETKKYQNVRGSLLERVHRVQDHGLEVYAGMIVGFDSDDETVFERQFAFLKQARIVAAMTGMLSAIPKTPLYDRLEAEGRLDNAAVDDPEIATNIIPLLISRETLRDGWLTMMDRLYQAENYFDRFDALFVDGRIPLATPKINWLRRNRPLSYLKVQVLTVLAAIGMLAQDLERPAHPSLSPDLRAAPPQAPARRTPAPLPLPVRLEVHHPYPLRHHDPADGARGIAAREYLTIIVRPPRRRGTGWPSGPSGSGSRSSCRPRVP